LEKVFGDGAPKKIKIFMLGCKGIRLKGRVLEKLCKVLNRITKIVIFEGLILGLKEVRRIFHAVSQVKMVRNLYL
jgi:hypothetical protein